MKIFSKDSQWLAWFQLGTSLPKKLKNLAIKVTLLIHSAHLKMFMESLITPDFKLCLMQRKNITAFQWSSKIFPILLHLNKP